MPIRIALALLACASFALAGDVDVKSLDRNKDGKVDKEELKPFLQALNAYNGDGPSVFESETKSVVVLGSGVAPAEFRMMPGGAPPKGPSPIAQAGDHIRGLMKFFLDYFMQTKQPEKMEEVAKQMVRAELIFAEAEIHFRNGNTEKAIALMRSVYPSEGEHAPAVAKEPHGKVEEHPHAAERIEAALKEVRGAIGKIEEEMVSLKKKYDAEELTDQQRKRVENAIAEMKTKIEALRAQRKDLEAKLKGLQGK